MSEMNQPEFYEYLLNTWNSMVDGTLDAKEWMVGYNLCFKLCTNDKESMVYYAYKQLFDTVSKTDIDHALYIKASESIARYATFLNRFWIPNQKNRKADVVEVYKLSELAWEANH